MAKPHAPACDRNRDPILEVLRTHFADRRKILEIASGTGQHAVHFAAAMPHWSWQTSDCADRLHGIRQWLDEAALPRLPPPLELDVMQAWPAGPYDAVFTANSLHIMGWPAVQRMFRQLESVLAPDAKLAIYGPFNYGGRFTSASNAAFDASLKVQAPERGIRDFEAVTALAAPLGLELVEDRAMPANNRCIVWSRRPPL
jgi:hypothetical protein